MLESSTHTQAFPLMPWIGFTLPALVVSTSHCCGLFLIIFLHCACVYSRVKLLVPTVCIMYNYVCVTQKCLFSILPAINHCQGLHIYCLLLRVMSPQMPISREPWIEHKICACLLQGTVPSDFSR